MPNYFRIVCGSRSEFVDECLEQGFIGVNFGVLEDLTPLLSAGEEVFRRESRDRFLQSHPDKTPPSGAMAAGSLWTTAGGIDIGDIILVSDGQGSVGKGGYHLAEVTSGYRYAEGSVLPHQRSVRWLDQHLAREQMSPSLRNSLGSVATLISLNQAQMDEVSLLLADIHVEDGPSASVSEVEEAAAFLFEKHLEDFLVVNWAQTDLSRDYTIVTDEDGEPIGQQFLTDTGPMDILAEARDGSGYLVVELKRDRATDAVVGQVQRYMGFVRAEIAEPHQHVRGAIIAVDKDLRLERALSVAPDIQFYRYEVQFRLAQD